MIYKSISSAILEGGVLKYLRVLVKAVHAFATTLPPPQSRKLYARGWFHAVSVLLSFNVHFHHARGWHHYSRGHLVQGFCVNSTFVPFSSKHVFREGDVHSSGRRDGSGWSPIPLH